MNLFYLDFETRSHLDLKKVGSENYAKHESTEVISMSYAQNDDPVVHGVGMRTLAWESSWTIVAFNIEFEQAILKYKFGVEHESWIDVMALAAQMSLPLNLKDLAAFFGEAKGDTRMVKKLSKPRRKSKLNPDGDLFWEPEDVPDDFDELYEYNRNDVEVMRRCLKKMMPLTQREQKIWELTRRMNERGVSVDTRALTIVAPLLDGERSALTAKFVASTGCSPRSPVKLAKFFGLPNVKTQTLERALKGNGLTPSVRTLVQNRLILGRASTSKLTALRLRTSSDGFLRGSLVYGGASRTGRWSSRGVQLQNLTRGLGPLTDDAFELLFAGRLSKGLLELVPGMIRGFFVGPFMVGDYAQIEARLLAWLARDQKQMDEWASGADLYRRMAARIYHKPEKEVTDHERFIGKNTVLGCGYGMGGRVRNGKPSKFQTQLADKFGVDISPDLAELAVDTYRQTYSSVVNLWYGLERGFRLALHSKSGRADAMGVVFERTSICGVRYVVVVLPSRRRLYYANPVCRETGELQVFSPRTEYTAKPGPTKLYGGKITENIIQALARDLMADHILEMDEKGFQLVLLVHDEVVSKDDGRLEMFTQIMKTPPKWASGLPLGAETKVVQRYQK